MGAVLHTASCTVSTSTKRSGTADGSGDTAELQPETMLITITAKLAGKSAFDFSLSEFSRVGTFVRYTGRDVLKSSVKIEIR